MKPFSGADETGLKPRSAPMIADRATGRYVEHYHGFILFPVFQNLGVSRLIAETPCGTGASSKYPMALFQFVL
ncbi:MAG: hypothetical protein ABSG20_01480 [Bradyrhizobium sp.]|jgi:hypothetical protein